MEKGQSVRTSVVLDRIAPIATAEHASLSAGECGDKDQVSRSVSGTCLRAKIMRQRIGQLMDCPWSSATT